MLMNSAESQQLFVPAVIPRRRQKQLMELYPPHVLPPSPINPVKEPLPIKLEDGTIVEWTGEFTPQSTESTLYSSRKRAFKGTKAERTAPVRAKERAARLKGMEKRIAEWKKVITSKELPLTSGQGAGGCKGEAFSTILEHCHCMHYHHGTWVAAVLSETWCQLPLEGVLFAAS